MTKRARVGNRLRDLRQSRSLTQQMLAESVGVSRQTIIAVEQGRFTPSVRLALELARALEAPLEELFWIQDGPAP